MRLQSLRRMNRHRMSSSGTGMDLRLEQIYQVFRCRTGETLDVCTPIVIVSAGIYGAVRVQFRQNQASIVQPQNE